MIFSSRTRVQCQGPHGYISIYMRMHSPQIGNILCQLISFQTLPNLSKIKRWIAYQNAELRTPQTLDNWTSNTFKHLQNLNSSLTLVISQFNFLYNLNFPPKHKPLFFKNYRSFYRQNKNLWFSKNYSSFQFFLPDSRPITYFE